MGGECVMSSLSGKISLQVCVDPCEQKTTRIDVVQMTTDSKSSAAADLFFSSFYLVGTLVGMFYRPMEPALKGT